METSHRVVVGDSRSMEAVDDGAVELVVTSPPYPMIEMWDDAFAAMDGEIGTALAEGDGERAFESMHAQLDRVWTEVERVLAPGGIACINVGDATRTLDGEFRLYPNHARVTRAFRDLGFRPLPPVRWRKPTNRTTKFMGSGMLPPNAYVTLEHEYVLLFGKGGRREFEPRSPRRYESAYFWEERNEWFSDLWEVAGESQDLNEDARERSGAFPVEIPYRLLNMFSVYGDTVLDPFWGTGTTTLAAMLAARNSVGYEVDPDLASALDARLERVRERSRERVRERLDRHRAFVREQRESDGDLAYEAEHYDFRVRTKQERGIRFYGIEDVSEVDAGDDRRENRRYVVRHEPI